MISLNLTDSDLSRGKERKVTKLSLIIRTNFLNKTELILGLDSEKFLKLDRVDGSVSWWILGMFYDLDRIASFFIHIRKIQSETLRM